RGLSRRIGRQRRSRPLRAAPAPTARQPAPERPAAGGRRAVRGLETRPVHRRGRQQARPWRGHGLAVRLGGGGDRRGVDRRRPGQGPRHLAGDRSGQHRQPSDHRGPGQRGRGSGPVASAAGGSGMARWHAAGTQLRPVPDPAAVAHGPGACAYRRERREDGRHRRTAAASGGARRGQCGGATDRPAYSQHTAEPPYVRLTRWTIADAQDPLAGRASQHRHHRGFATPMESIDLLVLRTTRDWLAAGERVLLATVARTWGSSPRPVGSMMALRSDGRVVGSVSGGCIEDDLIHRHTTAYGGPGMHGDLPQVVRYGVSADEAHRFGLPCGGTLELVLEFQPAVDSLDELLASLDTGNLVRRELDLA